MAKKDICPQCGGEKRVCANLCRACFLDSIRNAPNFCADCEKRISLKATRCQSCASHIRQAKLWQNPEYRKKICATHKKNRQDPEWRRKISEWLRTAWAEGKFDNRTTEEYRLKLSQAAHKAWAESDVLGSEEWLAKKSQSAKRAHARGCYKGIFQSPTQPEKDIMALLEQEGLMYVFQYQIKQYYYDFFVLAQNVLIEYDGGYWHTLPNAQECDVIKTELAKEKGFDLVRLHSPIARNLTPEEIQIALKEACILSWKNPSQF